MKICLSTLFFYKNELSFEFVQHLQQGLSSYSRLLPAHELHLYITNNAPSNPLGLEFSQAFDSLRQSVPNLKITCVQNEWNKGFGSAHNEAFEHSGCDVFVGLNNDLFFGESGWLDKLVAPIESAQSEFVGLKNAPRILKADGNGAFAENTDDNYDYAEGSAFAVTADLVRNIGLFAPDIRVAYCEDSDFSLRARQAGYQIEFVTIEHEHRRSSSTKIIPQATLEAFHERNRSRLLSRWGQYLSTRQFTNKIFLELVSDGWGDVFCSLPAVLQLRADHPTAEITVRIKQSFLACLFDGIDRLKLELGGNLDSDEFSKIEGQFDRIFRLQNISFTESQLLGREIASALGVDFHPQKAEAHLKAFVDNWSLKTNFTARKKTVVLHADYARSGWEGRGPAPKLFSECVSELKNRGYWVVAIGSSNSSWELQELASMCNENLIGQTAFSHMIALIAQAELFVGIDSGPIHIAQHLGTKTFAVFGATLPTSRMFRWDRTDVFMNWNLGCLGCYQKVFKPNAYNFCIRRDEACVKKIAGLELKDALVAFLDKGPQNLPKALELLLETQAVKREFFLRTGLVKPENDVELDRLRAELNSSGYRAFRFILAMTKKLKPFKFLLRPVWRGAKGLRKALVQTLQPRTGT